MDTTEGPAALGLILTPCVRTILSPELSAALLLDNERQMHDLSSMNERLTREQRMAFAARVEAIDADVDQRRRMRQVCALQDALPSGGVLCYSDGSVARIATCDLRPEGRR